MKSEARAPLNGRFASFATNAARSAAASAPAVYKTKAMESALTVAPAVYRAYDMKVCFRSAQLSSRAACALLVISTSRFLCTNLRRARLNYSSFCFCAHSPQPHGELDVTNSWEHTRSVCQLHGSCKSVTEICECILLRLQAVCICVAFVELVIVHLRYSQKAAVKKKYHCWAFVPVMGRPSGPPPRRASLNSSRHISTWDCKQRLGMQTRQAEAAQMRKPLFRHGRAVGSASLFPSSALYAPTTCFHAVLRTARTS